MALPRWLRRVLALLLPAAAITVPVLAAVVPLSDDYAAAKIHIAEDKLALDRYQRTAQILPQQRATLAALEQQSGRKDGFLAGGNETLIAAELQNRVKTVVEAAQAELHSTQVLPPRSVDGFHRIGIRAEMTGELSAVQAIIYRLEATSPTLFLDNVVLRIHPTDRRDGSDDAPPLDVSFEVYGFGRAQR